MHLGRQLLDWINDESGQHCCMSQINQQTWPFCVLLTFLLHNYDPIWRITCQPDIAQICNHFALKEVGSKSRPKQLEKYMFTYL